MSRAQRILQCVASRPFPCVFDMIFKAVRAGEPEETRNSGSLRAAVSAQLKQLVDAKKLRRTGSAGAYLYHATRLTNVDLRKVDAEGKPRDKSAARRGRKAPAAAPPATTRRTASTARLVSPKAEKPAHKPLPHQHMTIAPAPAPPTQPIRAAVQRESVEEFLARGGRIQRLANGVVSKPLEHIGLHEQARRRKAARKQKRKSTTTD